MLNVWKTIYYEVRQKIEESGFDKRWDFDRKRLFEQSEYMANVCDDLYNMAQTQEEFYSFFGPELKAVTGDPKRIDEVLLRVDNLVKPLELIKYDAFSPERRDSYRNMRERFDMEVKNIEQEAIRFIDESFRQLRSAEGAFNLLQKFKHIRSRPVINNQLMNKFNDILKQYTKEVDVIADLFRKHQTSPTVFKLLPPSAGALEWERSLFIRMKATIIKFQNMEEQMVQSDLGKETRAYYLKVGKEMRNFDEETFNSWHKHTEHVLPQLLRKTLLTREKVLKQSKVTNQEKAADGSVVPFPADLSFPEEAAALDRGKLS